MTHMSAHFGVLLATLSYGEGVFPEGVVIMEEVQKNRELASCPKEVQNKADQAL